MMTGRKIMKLVSMMNTEIQFIEAYFQLQEASIILEYMNHIEKKEYEAMYAMIDSGEKAYLEKEEYIQRNSKIYEGIEVSDIKISHVTVKEKKADTVTLSYETSCNTIAGTIQIPTSLQ